MDAQCIVCVSRVLNEDSGKRDLGDLGNWSATHICPILSGASRDPDPANQLANDAVKSEALWYARLF